MRPIGGFFELELPDAGSAVYHPDAVAVCSGRACLRRILEALKPTEAWLPFYICNAAVEPFDQLGVPYTFFGIDEHFEPSFPVDLPDSACVLYVNYFGLKKECAEDLPNRTRARVIIDDTHAFFERGHGRSPSFNSARKFFGVPDGAYAYFAELMPDPPPKKVERVHYEHLVNRLLGRQDLAYPQYVESERAVSAAYLGPSVLTDRLLRGIDYGAVQVRRIENFRYLHSRLGKWNRLGLNLDRLLEMVPLCYPFLPESNVRHESLWQASIFVPRLWPEVQQRPGDAFELERMFASRLLPLPIDHRYGVDDMAYVSESVIRELA